jgi:hypothetical protein
MLIRKKVVLWSILGLVIFIALLFVLYLWFMLTPKIKMPNNIFDVHFSSVFSDIQKGYKFEHRKAYIYKGSAKPFTITFSNKGELLRLDFDMAVEKREDGYDVYHFSYYANKSYIMGEKIAEKGKKNDKNVLLKLPAYKMFEKLDDYAVFNWTQLAPGTGDIYEAFVWNLLDEGTEVKNQIIPEGYVIKEPPATNIQYTGVGRQKTVLCDQKECLEIEKDKAEILDKPAIVLTIVPLKLQDDVYSGTAQVNIVGILE